MAQQDYVYGDWIDSSGAVYPVKFKKKWGEHLFSEEESKVLLQGDNVVFPYKKGTINGHLQYRRTQDGTRYFGFCPDFDNEYIGAPIYNPTVDSRFEGDRRNEALVNQFMKVHYYSKLLNSDGTSAKSEFINDESRQKQGVDVILSKDKKRYIIDEKAQMDYIYRTNGPLGTFALELLNSSSGKVGWFINDNLETEYYMFIWPHADGRLVSVNNIEYAQYALVEKNKLKDVIERRYQSADRLREYALRLSRGSLDGTTEQYNRLYYKRPPFDENAYLVYTKEPTEDDNGKVERPVNLVVKKILIEGIAEDKGILTRIDEINGGTGFRAVASGGCDTD